MFDLERQSFFVVIIPGLTSLCLCIFAVVLLSEALVSDYSGLHSSVLTAEVLTLLTNVHYRQ